jgi:DNA-binding NarL/FixJ family response regulator
LHSLTPEMGSFLFAKVGELGIDMAARPVYTGDMSVLAESQPVMGASASQPKQPIRVLLVARHPAFLDVIARLLARFDQVIIADAIRNGEDVLTRVQDVQPDVILFDLDLSGHPHLKTIRRLRISLSDVGIVALSLLDTEGYRHATLAAGADELIVKANLSTDLLPAIECAARASRPGPEPS